MGPVSFNELLHRRCSFGNLKSTSQFKQEFAKQLLKRPGVQTHRASVQEFTVSYSSSSVVATAI